MKHPAIDQIAQSRQLPVFIGVTGHRNIRCGEKDLEKLAHAVKDVLTEIIQPDETTGKSKKYPHTEFMLLTSLAAGGDQFVTEIARNMGMRYGVVLPMEREKFLNRADKNGQPNFNEMQKAKARELMDSEQCLFVYELPDEGDDDLNFREAARFISDNSCCGIALWDGLVSVTQKAGTGAAVRDSLHGVTYRADCFPGITIPETRPIYHIYTPRADVTAQSGNFYKTRSIFPQPLLETGEKWFSLNDCDEAEIARRFSPEWEKKNRQKRQAKFTEHLRSIDRYNRDAARCEKYIETHRYDIAPKDKLLRRSDAADVCEQYYFASDALALRSQTRRNHLGRWIIALAGLSYLSLNFFSDFRETVLALLLYVGFLAVTLLLLGWVKLRHHHESYVLYRSIAEGLRVQFFWTAGDVRGNRHIKAQVQDYYLRRQKGHIEWVRMALRTVNLLATACEEPNGDPVTLEEVKNISELWLGKMDRYNPDSGMWEFPLSKEDGITKIKHNGQSGYYLQKSLHRLSDVTLPAKSGKEAVKISHFFFMGRLFSVLAAACIAVSVILIIGLTAVITVSPQNALLQKTVLAGVNLQNCIVFTAGLLPIAAMVLRECASFMGYDEDVRRCTWYYSIFKPKLLVVK